MSIPAGADGEAGHRGAVRNALTLAPPVPRPAFPAGAWGAEPAFDNYGARFDPAGYWRIVVKHRWVLIAAVVTALVIGAAATLLTRKVYTADATLRIDREVEKVMAGEAATSVDNLGEEFYQTQYGMLRSRALAIRVAETLGLTRDDRFIDTMTDRHGRRGKGMNDSQARRDETIELLQDNESVAPQRGSRLVGVAFSSPDPTLSARVANAFAENFIASALDQRFESSSYARDFLERRLAQVRAKLEQSERDLVAYARLQQIIPMSGGVQPNNPDEARSLPGSDLESFNTARAQATTDRIRAEQRWRQAQASPGMGLPDILQSPTIQELSKEHARQVAEYQDKSSVFKPEYPDMLQLKARIDETERQLKIESGNIRDSLRAQYVAALANERSLSGQVEGLKSAVLDLRGRSIQYTILQREVDTNRTLYDGLLQRYKEVGVVGAVAASNIAIVDRAEAPKTPSRPRPVLNMLLAGLAGLILGAALAFLREAFDQTIRTPLDLEAKLGLPLLGSVPALPKGETPLQALSNARSPLSEAYYSLRSALQFSTTDGFPKTLLVTSPWPGGGKSTTALAIAQNVARLGSRVLIVDCDLRSPSLHTLTGAENHLGLSNALTGAASLKDVIQATALANLYAVTAGPPPPNPAELLAGMRLRMLVAEAGALFDFVIFDGPPIMSLADAPMIGAVVAGSLLVVESRRTSRAQVVAALRRMGLGEGHILGAVLTRYTAPRAAYGYGYDYYGGEADTPRRGVIRLSDLAARARRLVSS